MLAVLDKELTKYGLEGYSCQIRINLVTKNMEFFNRLISVCIFCLYLCFSTQLLNKELNPGSRTYIAAAGAFGNQL